MNPDAARRFVDAKWDDEIIPELVEYIKVPNKSPAFDPAWAEHGYMDDVVGMMSRWVREQTIAGLQFEVVRLPGRTPLLYLEIPASEIP
ncbi:MAG: peptidase M20, partial [Gammaproteobacteria bacterium]|nr:peptidase M20 [Gammaproteobacteria bacterium]